MRFAEMMVAGKFLTWKVVARVRRSPVRKRVAQKARYRTELMAEDRKEAAIEEID